MMDSTRRYLIYNMLPVSRNTRLNSSTIIVEGVVETGWKNGSVDYLRWKLQWNYARSPFFERLPVKTFALRFPAKKKLGWHHSNILEEPRFNILFLLTGRINFERFPDLPRTCCTAETDQPNRHTTLERRIDVDTTSKP